MSHTKENYKKITTRINRIKGQLESVEKGLNEGRDCYEILQTVAAAKGAINSLFGELVEDHIKEHVLRDSKNAKSAEDKAALEVIKLIKTYWK